MAFRLRTRISERLGTGLAVVAVGAMLACAEDESRQDTSESLPSLPIEVVEDEQPRVEDYETLGAVREVLWGDPQVGRRAVAIDVHQGTVTLTGTVSDTEAKRRALQRAASVEGVRQVVDRINVREGHAKGDDTEPTAGEAEPGPSAGAR